MNINLCDVSYGDVDRNSLLPIANSSTTNRIIQNDTNLNTILKGPTLVQIIEIKDISHSKLSQIYNIQDEIENSKTDVSTHVIRINETENDDQDFQNDQNLIDSNNNNNNSSSNNSQTKFKLNTVHKITVQDAAGTLMYLIEESPIPGISPSTLRGSKLILQNIKILLGVGIINSSSAKLIPSSHIINWEPLSSLENRLDVLKNELGFNTDQ